MSSPGEDEETTEQLESPTNGAGGGHGAPSEQLQKKQPLAVSNKKPGTKIVGGRKVLSEVLPKAGLVYSEKGNLSEVLCKPKIMPIKSLTLEKIQAMEDSFRAAAKP